jgi:hypothetical protein
VDKGKRKRIADVAEKLGVGLLLGTLIQGIFREISFRSSLIGVIILVIAAILIVTSISLSQEE